MNNLSFEDVEYPEELEVPSGYREVGTPARGRQFVRRNARQRGKPLKVIVSRERHDGDWYLHVSCSKPHQLPSYQELMEVKADFVGDDRQAIQVFPSKGEHRNVHPHCLHLWAPVEGQIAPDSFGDTVGPKALSQ